MSDSPLSARPTSSAFGPSTEPVKTALPFEAKELLRRRWRAEGYGSESDLVREVLLVFLYGEKAMTNVHADRIRGVAQSMARTGTETLEGAAR